MSSGPEFYPNITSELRRFYECFSHSANSQVLTLPAVNQIGSEYLMKTIRSSSSSASCDLDCQDAQVILRKQVSQLSTTLTLFLTTFLGIPLSKFLWILILPVPTLITKKSNN